MADYVVDGSINLFKRGGACSIAVFRTVHLLSRLSIYANAQKTFLVQVYSPTQVNCSDHTRPGCSGTLGRAGEEAKDGIDRLVGHKCARDKRSVAGSLQWTEIDAAGPAGDRRDQDQVLTVISGDASA